MASARVQAAVLCGLMGMSCACADVFYLEHGATIAGRLLGEEGGFYRVRTVDGVISLPIKNVQRVESGPTVLDEYDARLKAVADTATAQAELGAWCQEQGLRGEARKHLERALALDADNAAARRALGFVRVGGLWVDARATGARREPREADPQEEQDKLLAAVRGDWTRRIRGIRSSYLESSDPDRAARGRSELLAIDDPIAIQPLVDVLSRGDVEQRRLLVEALSHFSVDEATMHLAIIGLVDRDQGVREAAVAVLGKRDDPQIIAQYLKALHVRSETVVKRASYALGELKAKHAVSDLIDLLTEQQLKWVEVPVREYFELWPHDYYQGISGGPPGGIQVGRYPLVSTYVFADQTVNEWHQRSVTVYRTEVREALVKITGQDFGFERDAWLAWFRSTQPQSP